MQKVNKAHSQSSLAKHIDGFLPRDSDAKGATRDCADWQEGHRNKDTYIEPEGPCVMVTRLKYSPVNPNDMDWIIATWGEDAQHRCDEPKFNRLIRDSYNPSLQDLLDPRPFWRNKYGASFRLRSFREVPKKKRHKKAQRWVQKDVLGQTIWVKARSQKRKRE